MTKTILKSVVIGALIGVSVFFMPRFILGMFIFFGIWRLIIGRRMRGGRFIQHRLALADKIRTMSEEEYTAFKNNMATNNCHYKTQQTSTETSK